MVLNLSFVCSLFMLWLNVKKKISLFTFKCWEKWKNLQKPAEVMVATTFYGTCFMIDLLWFNGKRDLFILFWWKKVKMVSQSRLYFALLASVATMAFWMGMWRDVLSGYLDYYPDTWISRPFLLSKYPDLKKIEISKYSDTK